MPEPHKPLLLTVRCPIVLNPHAPPELQVKCNAVVEIDEEPQQLSTYTFQSLGRCSKCGQCLTVLVTLA